MLKPQLQLMMHAHAVWQFGCTARCGRPWCLLLHNFCFQDHAAVGKKLGVDFVASYHLACLETCLLHMQLCVQAILEELLVSRSEYLYCQLTKLATLSTRLPVPQHGARKATLHLRSIPTGAQQTVNLEILQVAART